jgi:hypothetical protein
MTMALAALLELDTDENDAMDAMDRRLAGGGRVAEMTVVW